MARAFSIRFGLPGLVLAAGLASGALAQEPAVDDIAVAVRDAGHACTDPSDATREMARSQPDEAAWTIRCAEGAYSVKFMGDTGAEVEPLP